MTLDTAEVIVEQIEMDGREARLREDYSGRGMYGRATAAVVTNQVGWVYEAAGKLGIETDGFRTDNMGLDMVVY